MGKLQNYPNLSASSLTGNDKVLIVRKNDQGLVKLSDLPANIPESLKTSMNNIFNKKFNTLKNYPAGNWANTVNLMDILEEKTASGSIASFNDASNDVPIKSWAVNISPNLDGVSSVDVTQAGKNILPNTGETATDGNVTFTVNSDGSVSLSGIASTEVNFYIYSGFAFPKTGTYKLTGCPSGGSTNTYRLFATNYGVDTGSGLTINVTNTSTTSSIRINIKSGVDTSGLVFKPQIEVGSTATTYEPYAAPTVSTVSLGRTIYGGSVDVVNGTGTGTNGKVVFNGTEGTGGTPSWTMISVTQGTMFRITVPGKATTSATNTLCSYYTPTAQAQRADGTVSGARTNVDIIDNRFSSVDAFKAWLAENPVTLVYEFATSTDFTFNPVPVSSYFGDNNLWSSVGNSTIIYRGPKTAAVNPTVLIEKTITQNGTYDPTSENANGYSNVTVNVETASLTTKNITQNGTYNASSDNADGYSSVTVDIDMPDEPSLDGKSISENGTYLASEDNLDGYSSVTVNVPSSDLDTKTITQNGTYDADDDNLDGYSSVTVNVPAPTLSTKTITQNGSYNASSDNADGYSNVIVNVESASLDSKEITENGIYLASADNLDGYSAINVDVPPPPPVYVSKTITENGSYDAQDDHVDGYSNVIVNVSGSVQEPYIYTIGDTAIDLGYKHNANTKVVCKLLQNAAKGGFYYAAFGARSDNYRTDCMIFFSRFNGNRYCYSRTGQEAAADEWWNQNYESSSYSYYGKPIIVTCEGNTCSWYEESDPSNVKSIEASSSTVDSGRANMAAFAMNNTSSNDGWSPNEYAYNTQIYWLKIYEGNALLHNFVPVQYGSDACFYDTVEQKYYYDRANGGKFIRSANLVVPEPITDLSSFTKIYNDDSSVSFDNSRMSTFLDKTNKLDISSTMMSGWRQGANYTSEDKIGAYGGWTSSTDMNLSFIELFMGKYEQQNKSIPIKIQYLDSNNEWQTITTVNVSASTPYPYNKFLVEMPENTEIYGIRWNHDAEMKTSGNNICFFGMLMYTN